MKYYVGKGTEFKKEECKEYKTLDGAMKKAASDENLVVWDETGKIIGSPTDNVPDGALQPNADGSVNAYNEDGQKVGTVSGEELQQLTRNGQDNGAAGASGDTAGGTGDDETAAGQTNTPPASNEGENGANNDAQTGNGQDNGAADEQQDSVIIPQGKMKVTVICDTALNLRRSPEWGNKNICGRAMRGQSYFVKAVHTIDGKKMVQTIDGIYLSGQSDHVQFEQL